MASQRCAIRVSAAVKLSITASARARFAIIVRVIACVTSIASRWTGTRSEGRRREPVTSGRVGLVRRGQPSSALAEARLPPTFTTGKRCANGGGGRGPPRPRCPKRRQKVRSVAGVRVT
ncbi:hypothetical protein HMPREF1138_2034 [Actinomyces sp. ICM58]|nr:hypothetical protein HMPREF1138_2034 [Actinomyces sp. ICM58]